MISGRAAFITGCSGGVGEALCAVFQGAGYSVIGTDRPGAEPTAYCDLFVPVDLEALVTDPSGQDELQRRVEAHLSATGVPLGCLINNAALQITGDLDSLSIESFERSHRINVAAPFLLAKLFDRLLRACRGSIVNVGSIHTRLTKRGFLAYSVSKAGLAGLTRALAMEFGAEVTVNTITPGALDTPMLRAGFAEDPHKLDLLGAHHPMGRIGQPDEIARAALFLASDAARFVTGAEIPVDGGIGARLHDPG